MIEIVTAVFITVFTDGTVAKDKISFDTMTNCERYIQHDSKTLKVGEYELYMNSDLTWTYKQVKSFSKVCV